MQNIIIGILFFLSLPLYSSWANIPAVQKDLIDGVEYNWIEDERFPSYYISIYFADGALSDGKKGRGETDMMFSLLDSGTKRYSHQQIADALEFYGVSTDYRVTHEFSKINFSGLAKDAIPTIKMVCHIFDKAIFPEKELHKSQEIRRNYLRSLSSNHEALADKAFRRLTLANTPFESEVEPNLKELAAIDRKSLRRKLEYFSQKVKKKVYISGPRSVWNLRQIFARECGWGGKEANFEREISYETTARPMQDIYLVTVPSATQAQLRIGRFLDKIDIQPRTEAFDLMSSYLGGGFNSLLMEELRMKRGMTYGAYAFIQRQKFYGRTSIVTAIRDEEVVEGINVIKDLFGQLLENGFEEKRLSLVKSYLAGSNIFSFERSSELMERVMFYDHILKDVDDISNYEALVNKVQLQEVNDYFRKISSWDDMVIVVVGSDKLIKKLSALGKVRVLPASHFL